MNSILKRLSFFVSFVFFAVFSGNVMAQVIESPNVKGLEKVNSLKTVNKLDKINAAKSNFQDKYKISESSHGDKSLAYYKNMLANASDSAYVYDWTDNDWLLDTRILYYIGASTVEIVAENKVQESGEWEKDTKSELLYYPSNILQRETNSFWKNSTREWVVDELEEFNESGLSTEYYSKIWNDTTQKFIAGVRITSTYENDTSLVEDVLQVWDTLANSWKSALMIENEFNSKWFVTKSTEKVFSKKINDWVNSYVIIYEYNEYDEQVNEKAQFWDTIANDWVNDVQIAREYNEIGSLTNQLVQVWDTVASDWENNNQRTVEYNDFFQLEMINDQIWDKDANDWRDTTKASYTYTDQGDISKYFEEAWNGTAWENVFQELYSYNAQNNLLDITLEEWDADNSEWDNYIKIFYTYDAIEGFIKSRRDEYWNPNTSEWLTGFYAELDIIAGGLDFVEYYDKTWNDTLFKFTGGFREVSSYYDNGQTQEIIIQEWDTTTSAWVNDKKIEYFWYAALSTEPIDFGQVSIYPVPFKNNLNIELKDNQDRLEVEIFNIQGQKMETLILDRRVNTVDLSKLKSGVYFVVYEVENSKYVRKIVKQ